MTHILREMEFESTAFDRTTGKKLTLSMTPIDSSTQRWTGELICGFGNNMSGGEYHVETGDGIRFYPFEVDCGSDIELLVQSEDSSHQLEFTAVSETEERDATSFNFSLPPLRVLDLCIEYHQNGLTPDLIDDIESTFDKTEQHRNLFEFISNARKCLRYTEYIELLGDIAEENETAKSWLADTQDSFFKNIAIGMKAGHQFPIASFNQLKERITQYESTSHLKEVGLEKVISRLLDDAAEDREQTIAEMTNFKIPFDKFVGDLEEVYFVQLLAASVNKKIDIPERELVKAYFEVNEPSRGGPFALLRQEAYDGDADPELWKATLAYSLDQGKEEYNEACANFLYWHADNNNKSYNFELTPQIYSAAKKKFIEWEDGSDHIACLAAYREYYYKGIILKQSDEYDAARESFQEAEEVAARPAVEGRLDKHRPFVKQTLIDIETNLSSGEFSDAIDSAEAGQRRLQETHNLTSQEYSYVLLKAWEDDIRAQRQIRDGYFESALETTQEAASAFKEVDKPRLAQVAEVREFQIKAYVAQSNRDFTEAKAHHTTIAKDEFSDIPPQTKLFHQMQAKLCSVKAALVEGDIEEAETALEQLENEYSRRREVQNISGLVDIYRAYLNDESIDVEEIVERFEINDQKSDRFRAYHGDYLSSAFFISFAQQLEVSPEGRDMLDRMVSYAIEYAITGSELSDWRLNIFTEASEEAELSDERTIQRLIEKGENKQIEFKETLLYDVRQDEGVKYLKREAVKEICAFANADGGKLLIGVDDDKKIKGLGRDLEIADDLDDLKIRLSQEISTRMGEAKAASYTEIEFVNIDEKTLCIVNIESSDEPIYYDEEEFFVRQGTSKRSLDTPQAVEYINNMY